MDNKIEDWHLENELRMFITSATCTPIAAICKEITLEGPLSFFTQRVNAARKEFDLFADQLKDKVTKNQKRKAIEIYMKYGFLIMINNYINWYYENEEEIKKYDQNNPCELMLSVIEKTKKEILKYFPEISIQEDENAFNLKRFENEMRNKQTISDKLNYWHEILIKYFFEPIERMRIESQDNYTTSRFRDNLITVLFRNPSLAYSFPIPETIYNEHFVGRMNNPELTYWFLEYHAKNFFKSRLIMYERDGGLNSVIPITKEILRINELEKDAEEWFMMTEGINLKTEPTSIRERVYIEIIRVLDKEFYKNNPIPGIHALTEDVPVTVFAEHIYLKDFLKIKLKKLEASGNEDQSTINTANYYPRQDDNGIFLQKPKSKIPKAISFTKNNYESGIHHWNNKNNNNLTKWLKSGQMVKIEEWQFVSKESLIEQKQVLNDLYDLINMPVINLADLHDEIINTCLRYANSTETSLDRFFADSKDMQITMPFSSLCPKIIKQPKYLIEAYLKHPKDLSEDKTTYYRHKYLTAKLGFGEGKFNEYKQNLNKSIRIEISNNNKDLVNSMFLFVEQFIDDLKSLHRTHFNYFASPLFRLLFEEVIKFKGYYIAAFGNFTFTNILEIEGALKTLEPLPLYDEASAKEPSINSEIETTAESTILNNEPNKNPNPTLNFVNYFSNDKPEKFAQKLKEKFAGKKGKQIALMIYTIKNQLINDPITKKKFYNSMAIYFEQSIGSDSSIDRYLDSDFNHKYIIVPNWKIHFDKMKNTINSILISIK